MSRAHQVLLGQVLFELLHVVDSLVLIRAAFLILWRHRRQGLPEVRRLVVLLREELVMLVEHQAALKRANALVDELQDDLKTMVFAHLAQARDLAILIIRGRHCVLLG